MKKTFLISIIFGCLIGFSQPLYSQDNIENGREYVNLGLPSGLLWASCNIGASAPEDYGNYYAWGEVTTKYNYSSTTSVTDGLTNSELEVRGIIDEEGNLTPSYDAAAVNWGGDWRMPTSAEMIELIYNCNWEWTKQGGKNGYKVTGPNGNSIFLPAAGYWNGLSFTDESCGESLYRSSTPNSAYTSYAYNLQFNSGYPEVDFDKADRECGISIRPVREMSESESPYLKLILENKTDKTAILKTIMNSSTEVIGYGFYWGTNPEVGATDNNVVLDNTAGYITKVLTDLQPNTTYYLKAYATNSAGTSYSEEISFTTLAETEYNDYVDLGLPSGLKWATYNIGATTASEYGNYYAWGEVLTKETYTEANSETYGESMSDISGTQYDAAAVNWGGEWRMPTSAEISELINNCTWTWTTQGGKSGYKVTGPNGNSIFLPAAGYRNGSSLNNAGSNGYYWSSSPDSSSSAYNLSFNSISSYIESNNYRNLGYTVRPVRE